MNEPKNTDFFPEIDERDETFVAPEIYQPYQDTEEDILHEERLKNLEAQIDEKFGLQIPNDELGELPYDAERRPKKMGRIRKRSFRPRV